VDFEGTPWPRMLVGDVAVDLVDFDAASALIVGALDAPDPLAVVSANLDHIHHFAKDCPWAAAPPAEETGTRSGGGLRWLTLLDGVPLVLGANSLTGRSWPKLSGSDIAEPILETAASLGASVGFLGGSAEAHRELRRRISARIPSIRIAGTWAPTRAEITDAAASDRIAADIRAAGVDILIVGLGKPRQEEWIAHHGLATGARVLLAFGAVIDFMAGEQQRAPHYVSRFGAEWAWRLAHEPRRLGRRYLVHSPRAWLRMKRSARITEASVESTSPMTDDRGQFIDHTGHAAITVVVVTFNSARHIPTVVDSLRLQARQQSIRLIVVDNDSSDDTIACVRQHDDVILVQTGGNLGYAGGINAALPLIGSCDAVLILNPDVIVGPNALTRLHAALNDPTIGAAVPLILDQDSVIFPSLYREPSLSRAFGDAFLGGKIRTRPGFSSEFDLRPVSYTHPHDVDWAIGAAILIPSTVLKEVGNWHEGFFLFSEEVDYLHRIRATGRRIHFEPSAVVKHRLGISRSSEHACLRAVNRVRYVELHHGRVYSSLYRLAVALSEALRSYDPIHRKVLRVVLNRNRWRELPKATKPTPAENFRDDAEVAL
jgi:exopolysaccharide biosynthesis WecB/TagA/CpsF family protein